MAVLCGMPPQYSTRLEALGYLCDCLSGRVQRWQVVKVIWHKTHWRRRRMVQCYSTGDGNMSSHEGTLAPPDEYDWICASFSPLESTRPQSKRHLDQFSRLHRWLRSVPVLYNGFACFPLKIAPSLLASGPHVICGSLGPPESWTQMATWSFQPFLQGSLVWHTDRATDKPRYLVRCDVIMRSYMGYGKATRSFYVITNNFATIKSLSVHLKHLINISFKVVHVMSTSCIAVIEYRSFRYPIWKQVSKGLLISLLVYTRKKII